ncbi:MAG: hypothetical protein NW207_04800 [Cytophagales bacterium]|nr:hypothetical protein [Cytophagales bacterium]
MKFKVNPTDHDTQAVVYEYKPAFAASHAHEAVALHGVVDEAKLRKSIMVEVKAEFERKEEREKLESAWDEIKEERERLKNWANKLSIVAESVLMNLVAKSPMLQGLLAGNMAPAPVLQGVPQTENEEQNSMTNEEVQRINNAVNKILMHFTVPEFEAAAEFLTKNVDMSKNFIKPLIK